MTKKLSKPIRKPARRGKSRKAVADWPDEHEQILRKAAIHLLMKEGMLLVPTALREEGEPGSGRWIITVTLRYPTGHEGYVGDLLYDGCEFRFLTDKTTRSRRVKEIHDDPALEREWNAFRASVDRPGNARNMRPSVSANGAGGSRHRGKRARNPRKNQNGR